MKKLILNKINLNDASVLTRAQLKNVLGGAQVATSTPDEACRNKCLSTCYYGQCYIITGGNYQCNNPFYTVDCSKV